MNLMALARSKNVLTVTFVSLTATTKELYKNMKL